MKMRRLIAASIAAAFVMPLSVVAADTSSSNSGAEKMFQALDKNKDGYLSREEVKGTPHDKDFDKLDKNHDGKLSREEHAAAPEHAGDKSSMGGTSGAPSTGSETKGGAKY